LWEILKKYDCKGLPINIVKEIIRQVLMGLDFLNRICRVIHTDLKPENVLVCLTEQELKRIVEDEQLNSKEEFEERLNYYCEKYNLGPVTKPPVVEGQSSPSESLESDD
jgi:serine/threonine-protein kinase SRPK3